MNRIADPKWLLKLVATLSILAWLILRANIVEIARLMASLSPTMVFALISINFLCIFVAAVKWWLLLPDRSLGVLFRLNMIAQFYFLFVPGQMGAEAVKAYQLGRGRSDAERVAASVFVDKVTGLIAVLVLGLGGAALTVLPLGLGPRVSFIGAIVVCVSVLFALRLIVVHAMARSIIAWAHGRMPRAERLFNQFGLFIESWRDYSMRPGAILLSVLIGILNQAIYTVAVVLLARQVGVNLPAYEWCWILAVVALAYIIPITIAGLGAREGALVASLSAFNVGIDGALAISFSLFAFHLLLGGVGALVLVAWKGAHGETASR